MARIAVVRIRGDIGHSVDIWNTLKQMHLGKKNTCAILDNTPSTMGMIDRIKDLSTFGEISDEFAEKMMSKRGIADESGIEIGGKKYKPYVFLSPPRKGFERRGIKVPFKLGGALGNRGDKMEKLLERML
jgi:large subunit ribosomal protein L30